MPSKLNELTVDVVVVYFCGNLFLFWALYEQILSIFLSKGRNIFNSEPFIAGERNLALDQRSAL